MEKEKNKSEGLKVQLSGRGTAQHAQDPVFDSPTPQKKKKKEERMKKMKITKYNFDSRIVIVCS